MDKIIGFAGFLGATYQPYSASTRGRKTCQETRNPQKTHLDNLIILLTLVQTISDLGCAIPQNAT